MNLLWRMKEEAARIKTIMPRYLHLEISRDCNLKCLGCYRMDSTCKTSLKGERNLTLEATEKIVEVIPSVKTIILLGDGEPLMNPDLGEILRYLSSKNIKSWIVTNGNLLTQDVVNEWIKNKVTQIHISLDAIHKESYEKIRRGGAFEKVMDALKIVGNNKVTLCINYLLYQETIQELPSLIKLAEKVNCKEINTLLPIFMLGSDLEGSLTRVKNNNQNRAIIQKATTLARRANIYWVGGIPALSPSFRHCNQPFGIPYITLGNDVYGCCYAVSGSRSEWYQGIPYKLPSPDFLIGNILDTPFKDIWLGENCKALRKFIKATERPRETRITSQELQFLKATSSNSRFSYCSHCLWRWGSAC